MRSNAYTLGFAAAVCVCCSLIVSGAATILRERQERNVALDMQKNILRAVGALDASAKPRAEEVRALYAERIEELVVDKDGKVVEGAAPADLDPESYIEPGGSPDRFPLYVAKEDGAPAAYAFPVSGTGLWSKLYGYLALEPDAVTVKGISFYKQGETPGLGAEIEKPWFQENFKGKEVVDAAGRFTSITVIKGKVAELLQGERAKHAVDGISGASITGKGVTRLVKAGLLRYEPFLKTLRKKRSAWR